MRNLHVNRQMDSHPTPGLAQMNIASGVLFSLSLVFHKASIVLVPFSAGYIYDVVYKTLAFLSVMMVITINTPKFMQEVTKRKKQFKAWKRSLKSK
jgi:hypothetical protein